MCHDDVDVVGSGSVGETDGSGIALSVDCGDDDRGKDTRNTQIAHTHTHHAHTEHFAQAHLRNHRRQFTAHSTMRKMTVEQLRAELERLGETPPKRWTKVELEQRLSEMYEEQPQMKPGSNKKVTTSLRQQVAALNQNSRKKAQLQEWCRTHLRMPISGNETIAQLQKAAMIRIYEETQPSPEDPVGFGRQQACPTRRSTRTQTTAVG